MDAVVTMTFEWWGGNARHAGFGSRGERSPGAKLTDEDVLEIKRLLLRGFKQQVIADLFGVKIQTINHISTRKRWSHVRLSDEEIERLTKDD